MDVSAVPPTHHIRGQTGRRQSDFGGVLLILGKPGAGKGTLSSRLVKKYDIMSLSTGDLLRQHIAEKSVLGPKSLVVALLNRNTLKD